VTFVGAAGLANGLAGRIGTRRRMVAVSHCRGLTRGSLWANRAVTPVAVDAGDGTVTVDGRVLRVDPVAELPLNRRYLLR
jgi:urease subunit alpha